MSTKGQLLDRQIRALTDAGCSRNFSDKKSGKNAEREELWKALDYLRPGDTLVVPSLDRLGRSIRDLIAIVSGLRLFRRLHRAKVRIHQSSHSTAPHLSSRRVWVLMTACSFLFPSPLLPPFASASGRGATRAASFAVMATVLAAGGHHLVFASTPSANACLIAALGLLAAALPRAGRPGSLSIDLSAMAVAQAVTSWWFTHLSDAPESAPASSHDGPWGMSYLAVTLAVSWALHAADTACSWLVSAAQEELVSLAVRLRALLVPWITPHQRAGPTAVRRLSKQPSGCVPSRSPPGRCGGAPGPASAPSPVAA